MNVRADCAPLLYGFSVVLCCFSDGPHAFCQQSWLWVPERERRLWLRELLKQRAVLPGVWLRWAGISRWAQLNVKWQWIQCFLFIHFSKNHSEKLFLFVCFQIFFNFGTIQSSKLHHFYLENSNGLVNVAWTDFSWFMCDCDCFGPLDVVSCLRYGTSQVLVPKTKTCPLILSSCWSPSLSTSLWNSSRWSCSRQISVSVSCLNHKVYSLPLSIGSLPLNLFRKMTVAWWRRRYRWHLLCSLAQFLFSVPLSSSAERTEGFHKPPTVDGLRRCRAEWSHSGAGAVRGRLQGWRSDSPPLRQVPKRTERYGKRLNRGPGSPFTCI